MNTNMTLEMVRFSTKEGVRADDARNALISLNDLLSGFAGFIGRKLAQDETGKWLDLVYWTDRQVAFEAAEAVMKSATAQAIFSVVDESSIEMNHFEVVASFEPQTQLS